MKDLYQLTPSQDVTYLQCKYTLFKRIINIITSATSDEEIDFDLMKKAINLIIVRNDCLRIQFVKKNKEFMQYFREPYELKEIPFYSFSTKEEQEAFIVKYRKSAIKYMKGVVFEPIFIKTYDNKSMVMIKVCHMIIDVYGINVIYKDLFEVYNALKNGTELPPAPASFEELVKKDLVRKNDKEYNESNAKFFEDYFKARPYPTYMGIHGDKQPIWQKQVAKGKKSMKMFFLANQTDCAVHPIGSEVMNKVLDFCKTNNCTLANFLLYTFAIAESRLNGNTERSMQLELCNCRATLSEKHAAGTKVQSLGCYTTIDYSKNFKENFEAFVDNQNLLYKHVGFKDTEFEVLLNSYYHKPLLETFYSATFSLIPYSNPKGVKIDLYSNGRFVLPAYLALMFNIDTNEINMAYDFQKKIISQEAVKTFHDTYVKVIKDVIENPEIDLHKVG